MHQGDRWFFTSISKECQRFVCLENKLSKSTYRNGRYFSFACVNSETHGASEAICFIVSFDFEGQMATNVCVL